MNVIIKNDVEKFAPRHSSYSYEDSDGYMNFRKGEKIEVLIINYPGNHRQQPEDLFSKYSNCDSWVFQSVYLHPEFFADEIDTLILTGASQFCKNKRTLTIREMNSRIRGDSILCFFFLLLEPRTNI